MKLRISKIDPQKKGLAMIILSMLIFGTIGTFRRLIDLPSGLLVCIRGFLGSGLLILFLKLRKVKVFKKISRKNLGLLILSGAMIGLNWITLFESYETTTVPITTVCLYTAPIFVILALPFILKERIKLKNIICLIISMVGLILVSGILETGYISETDIKGIILGLIAAVLYASAILVNKKVEDVESTEITVIQLLSAACVSIPYVFATTDFEAIVVTPTMIVLVLAVCLFHTAIAFVLWFGSMQYLSAQSVAIFSYVDPVTALICSALIIGEKLTVLGIVGAVLVLGSAFVSEYKKK